MKVIVNKKETRVKVNDPKKSVVVVRKPSVSVVTVAEQGPPGIKGDTGDPGQQGLQGPKGDPGDQGLQGVQGPKGDQGDQGLPGIQGPKGDPGDQGIQGIKGDQGIQGIQGEPGQAVSDIDRMINRDYLVDNHVATYGQYGPTAIRVYANNTQDLLLFERVITFDSNGFATVIQTTDVIKNKQLTITITYIDGLFSGRKREERDL
jgi:hypothetical protein